MTSWNCLTISGPMTLIGGLSIVTRQYSGDRRATRICAGFAGEFICVSLVGAVLVAMEFSSLTIQPEQNEPRNWTMVSPILSNGVCSCLRHTAFLHPASLKIDQ